MNNDHRTTLRVLAVIMQQQGLKEVTISQAEFEKLDANISWAKSPDGRELVVRLEKAAG